MREFLREAFRHNAWATRELLAFCGRLTPQQLRASSRGAYGDILATFNHLIVADAGYLPRTAVTRPAWSDEHEDEHPVGLEELEARAGQTARLWEQYWSTEHDPDEMLILDQGAYEASVRIPIVQALHHANAHREQICTILTDLGLQPPDLQAWAYGEAVGLARERHQ